MSWFVATGTAQQTISTAKITGCIKNIEEEYSYNGFSINSFPVSVFFFVSFIVGRKFDKRNVCWKRWSLLKLNFKVFVAYTKDRPKNFWNENFDKDISTKPRFLDGIDRNRHFWTWDILFWFCRKESKGNPVDQAVIFAETKSAVINIYIRISCHK